MSDEAAIWVVDRVEGDVAVLVDDDGVESSVKLERLGLAVSEGEVLRVGARSDGAPDWSGAQRDPDARRERLERAREALEDLKRRDPGGDVVL